MSADLPTIALSPERFTDLAAESAALREALRIEAQARANLQVEVLQYRDRLRQKDEWIAHLTERCQALQDDLANVRYAGVVES